MDFKIYCNALMKILYLKGYKWLLSLKTSKKTSKKRLFWLKTVQATE